MTTDIYNAKKYDHGGEWPLGKIENEGAGHGTLIRWYPKIPCAEKLI